MKKAILLAGALTVAMAALTACGGTGKAEPETTTQAAAEAATKDHSESGRDHGGSGKSGGTDRDHRSGSKPGNLFER